MKYLKVQDFSPPLGQEYIASAYPGPGLYLHSNGSLMMVTGTVMSILASQVPPFEQGGTGVDVHRLFDQLIELKKTHHG